MMRTAPFEAIGGFDPTVTAGEEPELCRRFRQACWTIRRIDAEMTRHDLGVTHFAPWWRRQVRSGYGSLDVTRRSGGAGPFARQVRSARIWTVGWLLGSTVLVASGWVLDGTIAAALAAVFAGALLCVQALRLAGRVRRRTDPMTALAHGVLTMASKWGELTGRPATCAIGRPGVAPR